jgi:hypothetical protein
MAENLSICGRCVRQSSNRAGFIGRLVLAVGLHLMMEEVIPTQRWMRWTIPDADERRSEWTATMCLFAE